MMIWDSRRYDDVDRYERARNVEAGQALLLGLPALFVVLMSCCRHVCRNVLQIHLLVVACPDRWLWFCQ